MDIKKSFIIMLSALLFLMLSVYIYADEKKNVLILNSYHQGYKWTDDEVRGIVNGLFPEQDNIKIYIEYMGTKWNFSSDYLKELGVLYKKKFKQTGFNVIISTDDDAFNFLKKYRDVVFGRVPVIFCGLNWVTPEKLRGMESVTGVNETTDISLNIYLMLKIHPEVKKIYVIIDSTTTGISVYNKLKEIMPQYEGKLEIIPLYNYQMKDIISSVSTMKNDSLVLLTIFSMDGSGQFFEYNEYSDLICKNSRVPVYGLWDFYMGHGILGGNLANGYSQGVTAGNIALRVLKGNPVENIPVVMNSPNTYMFDYLQMKRFGVGRDLIPAASIVINEPSSFYSVNKTIFNFIIAVTVASMIFSVILALNIRRRYIAEKSLSESVEQYSTLVNNLNVGVFRSSGVPDGGFIQVNPAMMKIFGYDDRDEFFNIPVRDLYQTPSDRDKFLTELKELKTVNSIELQMKKRDGSVMSVAVTGSAVFNEDGTLGSVDGILEDITEKKRMDAEIRHAQKMDTIGTLASGLAHDFNNSLGGVIGALSIMDHKLRTGVEMSKEKQLEYLTVMKESGEKGISMVKRLLSLARKNDSEYRPFNLNDIIRRVVELLTGVIDKSVSVEPSYYEDKAIVMGDPVQIEQALLNLSINAGHAMTIMRSNHDEWGGSLSIEINKILPDRYMSRIHPEAVEKEFWSISVADTGIGMPEEVMNRIFEPFFTTKGEDSGTGLGLAMVHKIINEHLGFIDVYSEPGAGTTFKINLPVYYGESEYMHPVISPGNLKGSGNVLLVEDEFLIMKIAEEFLKDCGYEVFCAGDGESALEIFKAKYNEISLVVMDMAMPVMSGFVAFSEMRKISPSVRVLIVSGCKQDSRVNEVLSSGGAGFVEKPYTMEELARAVRSLIETGSI